MSEEFRGNPLPDFMVNQIRRMYRDRVPIRQIARAVGVDHKTVYKYVSNRLRDEDRGQKGCKMDT